MINIIIFSKKFTGIRNARVFPLPVFAAPKTSRPFNPKNIDSRCISVGFK